MAEFDARSASLDLVTAYVSNNTLDVAQLPLLLGDVFKAITDFDAVDEVQAASAAPGSAAKVEPDVASTAVSKVSARSAKTTPTPAVPRKVDAAPGSGQSKPAAAGVPKLAVSIAESTRDPNFIVSLITGEKFKTLKRHLRKHGLTEAQYKARYGLPDDYAIVAASYSALRRKVAVGLHQDRKDTETKTEAAATAAVSDKKSALAKAKSGLKEKKATAPNVTGPKAATKSAPASKAEAGPKAKAPEAPAQVNVDVANKAAPTAEVAAKAASKPKKTATTKTAKTKPSTHKPADAPKAQSAEAVVQGGVATEKKDGRPGTVPTKSAGKAKKPAAVKKTTGKQAVEKAAQSKAPVVASEPAKPADKAVTSAPVVAATVPKAPAAKAHDRGAGAKETVSAPAKAPRKPRRKLSVKFD